MTHFKKTDFVQPLAGLAVADIGCGGGLLSEPLARLGATVTGIDAAPENIGIAQAHQNQDPVLMSPGRLTYRAITAEDLLQREGGEKFDIVCAMEIIEHVSDISLFVDCITKLLKVL
jgi:ubiquinone biosynthesis O-methyltransferase